MRRFMTAINSLDEFLMHTHPLTAAIRDELARIEQLDRGLPRRFDGSGGRPRSDRMVKSMAAGYVFDMLTNLGIKPVTTRGRPWTKLTAILFYIVTGRVCKDAQAICITYKKSHPRCSG
jgi:hypothetical protein